MIQVESGVVCGDKSFLIGVLMIQGAPSTTRLLRPSSSSINSPVGVSEFSFAQVAISTITPLARCKCR